MNAEIVLNSGPVFKITFPKAEIISDFRAQKFAVIYAHGRPGVTPQLTVGTVTTGNPGTDASVTITGTDAEPVLNFTIPRGATGSVGDLGDPVGVSHGGSGLTSSPSMLTNLGSTTAADIMAASPRPGVTGTLPIANGGTGVTTLLELMQAVFAGGSITGITSYPTKAGLYRITSQITGMPSDGGSYGVLAIFNAGTYILHLFLDSGKKLYYGYTSTGSSSAVISAPSEWRKVFTYSSGALPVANGGTGVTDLSTATAITYTTSDSRVTSVGGYYITWGKVCLLYVQVKANCSGSGNSFTKGSNIDVTLTNPPAPKLTLSGATYNSSNIFGIKYHTDKLYRIRNTCASDITSTELETNMSFTYLFE